MIGKVTTNFDTVVFESNVEHACSPAFELGAKGIRINVPEEVVAIFDFETKTMDPATRFPVCITIQFPLKYMMNYDYPRTKIILTIANAKTGRTFSSALGYSQPPGPVHKNETMPEYLDSAVDCRYFNVNLAHYIALPAEPGIYEVTASFEEYKSGLMRVKIFDRSEINKYGK